MSFPTIEGRKLVENRIGPVNAYGVSIGLKEAGFS